MKLLIALTLVAVGNALAQTSLGVAALSGTVRDKSGALVAAAKVIG